MALAISMSTLYLLFYLQDHLGFSSEEAGQKQTILIALYAFGTMLTAVVGGAISDRSGKRKKFVVTSTIIVACAALLLAFTKGVQRRRHRRGDPRPRLRLVPGGGPGADHAGVARGRRPRP